MKVKYKLDLLKKAITEPEKDTVYFLDKQTGDILTIAIDNPDLQILKRIKERIAKEPGRFSQIPKRSPRENYIEMEAFIETIRDLKLKKRLGEAIEGQRAFRGFRDALESKPREMQQWNTYREEKIMSFIRQFLKEIGVPPGELP